MRIRLMLLPVLLLALPFGIAAAPPDESVLLPSVEDTYVVADVSAPDDPQGLRDKNFGGLDFLKIWYASQVQAQEQIVSVGLVKFDLSSLKDRDIRSAHLQLFAVRVDLSQPVRLVDVSLAEGPWTEADATFKSLPQLGNPPLASAAVYGANVWYSWDVSPAVVRKAADGSVAYAIGMRTVESKGEEQVVFAAREAGRNAPRLIVALAPAAAPSVPPYVLPVTIAVAAAVAFGVGLLIGRRRWVTQRASAVRLQRPEVARPDDLMLEKGEGLMECPACRRPIPSDAEICPRCDTVLPVGSPAGREVASR